MRFKNIWTHWPYCSLSPRIFFKLRGKHVPVLDLFNTSYLFCGYNCKNVITIDAAASWHFCILHWKLSITFPWIVQDLVGYFQLWNFVNIFDKLLHFAFFIVHNNSSTGINHLHIIISKTLIEKPPLVITTFDVIQLNENTTNFYGARCMETKTVVL